MDKARAELHFVHLREQVSSLSDGARAGDSKLAMDGRGSVLSSSASDISS